MPEQKVTTVVEQKCTTLRNLRFGVHGMIKAPEASGALIIFAFV